MAITTTQLAAYIGMVAGAAVMGYFWFLEYALRISKEKKEKRKAFAKKLPEELLKDYLDLI